ncbi:ATP-binding cassette domain-containing protein [Actinomadura fulvescens]|uniref:ATP-binding cassette domain-containing protein n=1 Tax=Actinomadura fulvescens TaxID=46160 RepID=UPI0031D04B81
MHAINTEVVMAQIAIVFQSVHLRRHDRGERASRPSREVRSAVTAARLGEVIERLPAGWMANVGEGGALPSGGERQRVSIARALLKNAPIVLLDEVASALDPVNEAAVHEGIERLMAGRTVLMVAHPDADHPTCRSHRLSGRRPDRGGRRPRRPGVSVRVVHSGTRD